MLFKAPIPSLPFSKWLLSSKENKTLLVVSTAIFVLVFVWYKILYPFPNLFPDSYQYIAGAIENRAIDFRPIGYSKFLQLIHTISSSHLFLVWTQYILLQLSQLYLLFTINYFLRPRKWVFRTLIICCLLNPIIPHVSNLVSSDPLFTALNIIWLTQLLWIVVRPNLSLILIHVIILFMAFAVRYNAIYFPLISALVILWCRASRKAKVISLVFTVILLGTFIGFTQKQFKKLTGVVQFAPFSDWQIAANALEAYSHVTPDDPASLPGRFRELHKVVNKYMDSIHSVRHDPYFETSFFYMWGDRSPILQYSRSSVVGNYRHPDFNRWATIAPSYSQYGVVLIKRHPGAFLKYYILKNILSYNQPELEYLGWYNMGKKMVAPLVVNWFKLPSNEVSYIDNNAALAVSTIISHNNGFINIILIIGFLFFLAMEGFSKSTLESRRVLFIMTFVWISNSGFSILASPIHLRYLTFQIILTWVLVFLLLEFIVLEYKVINKQQHSKEIIINRISHKHT